MCLGTDPPPSWRLSLGKLTKIHPYSRFEAFTVSILLITLGFILEATSTNIGAFAAAQIFYVAGQVGIQFMQQIFAAGEHAVHNFKEHNRSIYMY